jgi:hypothetical protein
MLWVQRANILQTFVYVLIMLLHAHSVDRIKHNRVISDAWISFLSSATMTMFYSSIDYVYIFCGILDYFWEDWHLELAQSKYVYQSFWQDSVAIKLVHTSKQEDLTMQIYIVLFCTKMYQVDVLHKNVVFDFYVFLLLYKRALHVHTYMVLSIFKDDFNSCIYVCLVWTCWHII